MKTARLEAFSDGVIAIIITIMVLELRPPDHLTPTSLAGLWPVLTGYALSFALVAIYWVNHHNLLHLARTASRRMLWANILWLFWLSLIPFATAAIGRDPHDPFTMNVYGVVQLICAATYRWLWQAVLRDVELTPNLIGWRKSQERKGRNSVMLFATAIPMAWIHPGWSIAIYVSIAIAYVLPSRDFESVVQFRSEQQE
jgi:uncharacterized membrane protein